MAKAEDIKESLRDFIEYEFDVPVEDAIENMVFRLSKLIASAQSPDEEEETDEWDEDSIEEPFGDMDDLSDE